MDGIGIKLHYSACQNAMVLLNPAPDLLTVVHYINK